MRRRYRPTDLDIIQISFAGRPATRRPLLSLSQDPPPPCGVALSTVALSPSSLFSFLVQPLLLRSLFLRVAQEQKSVHRRLLLQMMLALLISASETFGWILFCLLLFSARLTVPNLAILTIRGRRWGQAAPGIKMDEWPE